MDKTLNLYQRISACMRQTVSLAPDEDVDGEYTTFSAACIISGVRSAMLANGLVILPIAHDIKRNDERYTGGAINHLTELTVTYRIINIDDPTQYIDVVSSGSGSDMQDKGIGKAMTYAYKYLFRTLLAIYQGVDDPDDTSSDRYTRELLSGANTGKVKAGSKVDLLREIAIAVEGDDSAAEGAAIRMFGKNLSDCSAEELGCILDSLRNLEYEPVEL